MLNYKTMTAKEAIRTAKEESGLTAEQIAQRLNVSISLIRRYLKEDDNYFPGLEMLPRLCLALGNSLLLDWAMAKNQTGVRWKERRNTCISNTFYKYIGRGPTPYYENRNTHLLGRGSNTNRTGWNRYGMSQSKRAFAAEKMQLQ